MRVTFEAMGQTEVSIDPSGTLIIEQVHPEGHSMVVEIPTYARAGFLNVLSQLAEADNLGDAK